MKDLLRIIEFLCEKVNYLNKSHKHGQGPRGALKPPNGAKEICAGGRARPRFTDGAKICAAQPLKSSSESSKNESSELVKMQMRFTNKS